MGNGHAYHFLLFESSLEIRYKKAFEDNLFDEAGDIQQQIHDPREMETLKLKLAEAKQNLNVREAKTLYDQILALSNESKKQDIPEKTNEKTDEATIQNLEIYDLYDQILTLAKESKNPDIPENTNEKMKFEGKMNKDCISFCRRIEPS